MVDMNLVNMNDDFMMSMETEISLNPAAHPNTPVAVGFGIYYQTDEAKTAEAGQEVYKGCEYIKIVKPGDNLSLVFQPAADTHRKRFPKAYAAFKARTAGAETSEELPIEQWASISRSMAMMLRAAHIHTVEALAAVHDGHIERLGTNGRELRAKAIAFLEQAKDSSVVLKLAAEKKELQDQLAAMQAQINALVGQESGASEPTKAGTASTAAAVRQPGKLAKVS